MTTIRCAWVVVLLVASAPMAAQESQSAARARELTALMSSQNLTAVAARDATAPDRFVAAMLFPGVQLLVVAARVTSPAYLQDLLGRKQYAEVYSSLQSAAIPETKVFFQDLKADGLSSNAGGVDVMYEQVVNQTIFDGDPGKHKMTAAMYQQKVSAADRLYSGLLTLLMNQLKPSTSSF